MNVAYGRGLDIFTDYNSGTRKVFGVGAEIGVQSMGHFPILKKTAQEHVEAGGITVRLSFRLNGLPTTRNVKFIQFRRIAAPSM